MPVLKVFEHQPIRAGDKLLFYRGKKQPQSEPLDEKYIQALWRIYDEQKCPFFVPTRGGIKFREFVGVIKVLDLSIEILPKADKNTDWTNELEQQKWQRVLIDMLRTCHSILTPTVSEAPLKLKSNSILELYIERFIVEVNYLINAGLIKRYRKEEVNSTTLRGKLLLQKHLSKNIVHKEKFYVSRSSYDQNHLLHSILLKTIKTLPVICNNQTLVSSCYALQLNFPEVQEIQVSEETFSKITYDRKSGCYRNAIEIAKLLLLNYRPDISSGVHHSIAILFNMNQLWEEYIYRVLLKAGTGKLRLYNQRSTGFWRTSGCSRSLKPDLVIEKDNRRIVLDTKWKHLSGGVRDVDMNDLRQMFAYHHYFDAAECYLLYPGEENKSEGVFAEIDSFRNPLEKKSCGVIVINVWEQELKNGFRLKGELGDEILGKLEITFSV